jgi:hypothetical protein
MSDLKEQLHCLHVLPHTLEKCMQTQESLPSCTIATQNPNCIPLSDKALLLFRPKKAREVTSKIISILVIFVDSEDVIYKEFIFPDQVDNQESYRGGFQCL